MESAKREELKVKYAGFWLRFVAYLIDDIILGAIGFVISLPFIGAIIFSGIALSEMDSLWEQAKQNECPTEVRNEQ